LTVGKRLIDMIRLLNIPHKASGVADHVSISIGIATSAAPTSDHTIQEVLGAADRCLYDAKASGRNCLESVLL